MCKKITNQTIIGHTHFVELNILISEKMRDGWQPYGQIFLPPKEKHSNRRYAQQMVKYEEDNAG